MAAVQKIGIEMTLDASNVAAGARSAGKEFDGLADSAHKAADKTAAGMGQISLSFKNVIAGAAGLSVVRHAIDGITSAITALPQKAFNYHKDLEVSQVGMAGILSSMTAINGQQTSYNSALAMSGEMIRKLNDDALRTAATSQELVSVFQALLAPGLAAKMNLEQIRELTVVGTNAVKSMGLQSTQVVQELRDLVAGGITAASSTLASALGLKDADIHKARASAQGLFAFLMERMQGFEASSEAFAKTYVGVFDQLQEGAVRVAAAGLAPLVDAFKKAGEEAVSLFLTLEKGKEVQLNQGLIEGLQLFSQKAAGAIGVARELIGFLWSGREAIMALGAAYLSLKAAQLASHILEFTAGLRTTIAAKMELVQASKLAAMQARLEALDNVELAATTRQKIAALLAELQAKQAQAQANVASAAARMVELRGAQAAIEISRVEVLAKLQAVRTTMAQAEAQLAASRAAGALSFAIAMQNEAINTLAIAQARHAALVNELAILGKQQAAVNTSVTATIAAQATAQTAASAATTRLATAQGAATVAGRALSGAVGFLGGPLGVVTTALTIGMTAWSMWGKSGVESVNKVHRSVLGRAKEFKEEVQAQIALLNQRNAARAHNPKEAKNDADAIELGALQLEIDKYGGTTQGLPNESARDYETRLRNLFPLLAAHGQLLQDIREREVTDAGTLTLTLNATEQAWRKANDSAKVASAAQEEYQQKLASSRMAWEAHKANMVSSGASDVTIDAAQQAQLEYEKGFATERDQKIKRLGAGASEAQKQAMELERAAVQHGYKMLAMQVSDGQDQISSLRQRELIDEKTAIEQKQALTLQDLDAKAAALQAELKIVKSRKDTAKEQQAIEQQLLELQQARTNANNTAARDLEELALKPQLEYVKNLRQTTQSIFEQAKALELQNEVFGLSKSALTDLNIAQLEQLLLDARATEEVIPGKIAAIEAQIEAQKRLTAAQGVNEALELRKKEADGIAKAHKDAAKKSADEWEKTANNIDGIFRGTFADLFTGGQNVFKSLGKSLRTTIATAMADALYSATLKNAVYSFANWFGAAMGNGGSAKTGIGSVMGAGGGINNITGLFGGGGVAGVSSAIQWLGGVTGSNAVGNFGLGMVAPALPAGVMGPAASGAAGAAGSAFGAALPWIGGGLLAISLLSGLGKGESRAGGQFGVAYDGKVKNNRRDQTYTDDANWYARGNGKPGNALEDGKAYRMEGDSVGGATEQGIKDAISGTAAGINETFKKLGSSAQLTQFFAGLETSGKGRGGVMAGGTLNTGAVFGESGKGNNYHGTFYDASKITSGNMEEMLAAFSLDLMQVQIEALQAVDDIPQTIKDKLKGTDGKAIDAKNLSKEAAEALLTAVHTQIFAVDSFNAAVNLLPFETLKNLSFDAASGLMEAAGGLEAFKEKLGTYYQNFYTEEERRAQDLKNVTAAMTELGHGSVNSKDAFRALMDAQDQTTEEGAKLYAALLAISGAFSAVHDDTKSVSDAEAALQRQRDKNAELQIRYLRLIGKESEAVALERLKEIDAMKEFGEEAVATLQKIFDTEDKINASDAAYATLERSVEAQRESAEAARQVAQETAAELRSLFDLLKSNVKELYNEVDSTRAMSAAAGRQFIDQALLTAARTGYLPESKQMQEAIAAARGGLGINSYTSKLDEDRDKLILAGKLAALGGVAGIQLSTAELHLKQAEEHTDYLDKLLKDSRDQLDVMRGVDTSVLSVADAVKAFQSAVLAEKEEREKPLPPSGSSGGSVAGPGGGDGIGEGVDISTQAGWKKEEAKYLGNYERLQAINLDAWTKYKQLELTAEPDVVAQAYQTFLAAQRPADIALSDLKQWWARNPMPKFAKGGMHSGGFRVVGENGPELEATGPARIYNAQDTMRILRQSSANAASSAPVQSAHGGLENQIAALIAAINQLKTSGDVTAQSTQKTAELLRRVTNDGEAMKAETR